MKKSFILILMCLFLLTGETIAQKRKIKKANKETTEWRYDLESEAISSNNSKAIRVWSYSKKADVAKNQGPKNAVHGVIFKGVNENPNKRLTKILPLIKDINAIEKHADFFETFFADGGDYRRYVTTTDIADKVRKIDRKTYKVGVVVNVNYNALRKALEQAGIVRTLNSGF